ncbi:MULTISPECIES: deoxyhypusine synthase [Acidiplasma]|jgi:deoxyhypusine synthase|uniref:Probable deoxyhypusine synthase n=2 Tax=Acidiplasma TaxID=507753 RepID=A0A0Q0XMG0_9ARCH|nr:MULTISPECIES: deoxyhypusine synthase [Acidiplasma]KQB36771.1 deoxyhypusine synthase [Acidiplasma cupricumulans]KJE49441.1 deoxyhypusine synthase [Acidiplasma sp. MBA-1]KPV47442.1 deoxyhypusine synthase [Acidiplasma aeolicum]KQB36748.1 deoxyhypusine synthase [Acidiplasma aeolicum]WMT54588.1 MAG: deoxyhypusine synthase [Acidiplasma sp.]
MADQINRDELLKDPVKDEHINKNTTLGELINIFAKSGGFTSKKIYEGYEILKEEFTSDETTFLSFPADIISTGTRGIINQLVKNKLVDVIITTNGTLDHDIARTYTNYYAGTFNFGDTLLRDLRINRLGNVFVPDESYGEIIEKKVMPVLEELYKVKKEWAGWELIREIGLKMHDDNSILYNAAKNDIPIFVPGITDGSVGSQLWSFYEMNHDFKINLLEDEHKLSDIIFDAKKTGALMIGGGISKHHTIWWNQFRDGLDEAVYVTTAQEYDGSLSGAKLEEAITWKKVKENAKFVNIYGDATVILPILLGPFL